MTSVGLHRRILDMVSIAGVFIFARALAGHTERQEVMILSSGELEIVLGWRSGGCRVPCAGQQERLMQRTAKEIVDGLVPQVIEECIEVELISQERIVEEIVNVPVPHIMFEKPFSGHISERIVKQIVNLPVSRFKRISLMVRDHADPGADC